MPYVGNDIVSLNDPDNRKKSGNIRFLNRVFTPNEQSLIGRSSGPDGAVWTLWAAKESAYKILSKLTGAVTSSPLRYEVSLFSCWDAAGGLVCGVVDTPARQVFFRASCEKDFVHCIASDSPDSLDSIRWGIERFDAAGDQDTFADESILVRRAAAKGLALFYQVNVDEVEIRRISREGRVNPPAAYWNGRLMPVDLSLSHDYPAVAYAFIAETGAGSPWAGTCRRNAASSHG